MEVITIESKSYQQLVEKIDAIYEYVKKEQKEKQLRNKRFITNESLAELLGISVRTLQRLRSGSKIRYHIFYHKCYYDFEDIQRAIQENVIHVNPKNMKDLRRNFMLKSVIF